MTNAATDRDAVDDTGIPTRYRTEHVVAGAETPTGDVELAELAIADARALLDRSIELERPAEARRSRRLGRLVDDPAGRELLFELTDQVLRIGTPRAAARRFSEIVHRHPTRALGVVDRVLLRVGARVARLLPGLVMPLVVRRLRAETAGVVLRSDRRPLARHLARRRAAGVEVNVNPLGEAILSDAEATERLRRVVEQVGRPEVDHVSVKVSAILAHLDPLALDDGVERTVDRLRTIFRAAGGSANDSANGDRTFVNLDMEEYADLEVTTRAFTAVLDEPEFRSLDAGIVVQAYLPDAQAALDDLGAWALRRRRAGGGRIRVRLVKGANLAMERVEAELHGWQAAPHPDKATVDAAYKALLESALRPEWDDAVLVGVASHNLFDLAWANLLAERLGQRHRMRVEMLEGMAPAQARAVHERYGGELRMYAPVVSDDDFVASLAYLSRRLDENTQPDNFLRSLFRLAEDDAEFERQAERFRASVRRRHDVDFGRRRRPLDPAVVDAASFRNHPDADPTDPSTRTAILTTPAPTPPIDRCETPDDVDRVLDSLVGATPGADERRALLLAVADTMAAERAETLALMAHPDRGVGKTFREGDAEVSEAVDFCRYYGTVGIDSLQPTTDVADLVAVEPVGTVAVIAPWNFPYAIPTGGVAAALAAGNRVVLKPAPEAVHVGAWIVDQFRRSGVDESLVRLVVCDDGPVGRHLVESPTIDTVILTGSFATAQRFLDWSPQRRVFAETSGKNAIVVTATADLDLAIADLVRSAFGHAGQKCSAASLAIVEAEVYDDPTFRRRLRDAVRSLRVGPADDPATIVGPLIGRPGADLERALTRLEPGEEWLVEPQRLGPATWTPGVRLHVAPGSWFHLTECFGPVLGVLRADDLDHAIELQNATDYALTGGIHSLDDGEIGRWLERVEVGNAYVNRGITGAIVRRQPFGGWKASSVGGGAKAGGPGHVLQFARPTPTGHDLERAARSYRRAWRDEFAVEHDPSGLDAESNVYRCLPLGRVVVRHDGHDHDALELLRLAAEVTGAELVESDARTVDDRTFAERALGADRVRLCCGLDDDARRVLHRANVPIDDSPPVADGRIELRRWVREQAVSRTLHRHGRLTPARSSPPAPPAPPAPVGAATSTP